MDPKRIALAAAGALLALALWLAWLWQPERQIRLHTAGLLRGIERRNWNKVQDQLADNYSDRWGHDKPFVLSSLRQVFGSFVFLDVEHQVLTVDASTIPAILEPHGEPMIPERAIGSIGVRVKISGQGSPVAQYVMAKVNGLSEQFTFTWEKRGLPWNWQLTKVDHPTLDPDGEMHF